MSFLKKIKDWYLWKKDPSGSLYYRNLGVNIGNNCSFIGTEISVSSEPYLIYICDNVRISFGVSFITHDGATYVLRKEDPNVCIYAPIIVRENTFIGANSIILPGVEIGQNVIIGAGSVVTKNIPNNEVWAGIPAKKICTIREYKEKNANNFSHILNYSFNDKKKYLEKAFDNYLKDKGLK